MRKSDESGSKFRILDRVSVTKLNYRLYLVVLLLAIAVLYLVVAQYFMYGSREYRDHITVEIIRNSVERFSDGAHPLVIINALAPDDAIMDVEFISDVYNTTYSSGDYTTNYTASAILPTNAFSTEFDVKISASERDGGHDVKTISFVTEKQPGVMFSVR